MADAIISVVVERLAATLEEQIRNEVNLVRGVEDEILKLAGDLNTVRNVLEDAEKKGYKDKSVKDWLMRLENSTHEMDDVLDEWSYSITKFQIEQHSNDVTAADVVPPKQKVWSSFIPSPCLCFKKVVNRRGIALKIKEVKSRLDLILAEKDRFPFEISSQHTTDPSGDRSWRVQTTSYIDLEEVCGRELEKENLVSKLVSRGEELGVTLLSVVGVGGLGKTTLAKLAYNDSRVEKYYELRIWICVSNPFDEVGIAKGIVESVKKENSPNTNQLGALLDYVKEITSGKKFLLVLDDVWTHDNAKWQPLKSSLKFGGASSKILVTTRNERVALTMGTVGNNIDRLGHLSDKDCWLLLGRIALSGKNKEESEKFDNIGMEIAKKCKGLPLAAKTLGSLLRFKNSLEAWENVLNSEIWEFEEVEVDLFPHLLLSYNELSPTLKRCFSYCAVFPKDTEINVDELITKWMALGYLGHSSDWKLRGREYFDKLATRSLFQDFWRGSDSDDQEREIISFKMHDIVHDFAQFLRKNVGSGMKKTTCITCEPSLVSHVQEYRSLIQYNKALPDPQVCDCLTSVRVLKLRDCGLEGIPKQIEKLIHLRWLDLSFSHFGGDEDLKSICKLYSLQFLFVEWCGLKEIPSEIGNLIHLIELNLSRNKLEKGLPESLCNLRELESLGVEGCGDLCEVPQGIHRLVKLKHLYTDSLVRYPQGLAKLTSLVTLRKFGRHGGRDGNKLGWLKNLNRLSRSLSLGIEIKSDDVEEEEEIALALVLEDAREAELGKKMHIEELAIRFYPSTTMGGGVGEEVKESSALWIDVLDALKPHPNLQKLKIEDYNGSRLPQWISSPLNKLRSIEFTNFGYLSLLPPLGKLPLLETLVIWNISELEVVGREFLGITTTTTSSSSSSTAGTVINGGFPRLRDLEFQGCSNWRKWEDITSEEEDCVGVSIMPCLTRFTIQECDVLRATPQRLLRKVSSSLKVLNIGCTELIDALEPHPNLQELEIHEYKGWKLPEWIESPLNQLTSIILENCVFLSSLPPLGKLPLLETLRIRGLPNLEFVGPEFLGITTTTTTSSSSSSSTIIGGFPKLRELEFSDCVTWMKWEDTTAEEENDSAAVVLLPCLEKLTVRNCGRLKELPRRLLRKASPSLQIYIR